MKFNETVGIFNNLVSQSIKLSFMTIIMQSRSPYSLPTLVEIISIILPEQN